MTNEECAIETSKAIMDMRTNIAKLEKENAELKEQVENRNCSNCRRSKAGCPNDGSCHNFSLEFGYNKANEWHYVKKGDLPRQYEHTCFSIDVLANNKKWVYYEFSSGKWFCGNKEVNVIAWKEIKPPKEITE